MKLAFLKNALAAALLFSCAMPAVAQDDNFTPLVIIADEVVHRMLRMADVGPNGYLLKELKPVTRIVAHDYNLGDWLPDEWTSIRVPDKPIAPVGISEVFLWVVPGDARGRFTGDTPNAHRRRDPDRHALTRSHRMARPAPMIESRAGEGQ